MLSNILTSFFNRHLVFNAHALAKSILITFEILVLVLFLACLQNAWQRGS
jgi:hypothetical protein